MRTSALLTAAFAATALSAPVVDKRDLVVDTVLDVVYVTEYDTVTAGASTAVATSSATSTAPVVTSVKQYGHRHSWYSSVESSAAPTTAASSTSIAVSTPVSIPIVTSTPSSTYIAPTTESAATSSAAASTSAALSSSAEASQTSSSAGAFATTYQQLVVAHHNVHRANHSASNIVWDAGLASTALSIAKTCVYEHNVTAAGGGYGQNIAAGVDSSSIGVVISDLFYNGEVNNYVALYGQANPSMTNFENWGHFSQIVWKATSKVGCATYDCSASGLANTGGDVAPYFTVCNYESPGNYAGEYGTDVGSPLNHGTIDGTAELSIS